MKVNYPSTLSLLVVVGLVGLLAPITRSSSCGDAHWYRLSFPSSSHWYSFSRQRGTFHQAEKYCASVGGGVVEINSESEYMLVSRKIESTGLGSVWVSSASRPEDFGSPFDWDLYYASGEPDFSGPCHYLSGSRGLLFRDTKCHWEKGVVCEREGRCEDGDDDDLDDEEGQFDVDHFDPVNRNGIESGSSGADSLDSKCLTVDGIPCSLPFIYEGRAYAYCTADGDFDGRPWCSTSTDALAQHSGDENWGYCQETSQCGVS